MQRLRSRRNLRHENIHLIQSCKSRCESGECNSRKLPPDQSAHRSSHAREWAHGRRSPGRHRMIHVSKSRHKYRDHASNRRGLRRTVHASIRIQCGRLPSRCQKQSRCDTLHRNVGRSRNVNPRFHGDRYAPRRHFKRNLCIDLHRTRIKYRRIRSVDSHRRAPKCWRQWKADRRRGALRESSAIDRNDGTRRRDSRLPARGIGDAHRLRSQHPECRQGTLRARVHLTVRDSRHRILHVAV